MVLEVRKSSDGNGIGVVIFVERAGRVIPGSIKILLAVFGCRGQRRVVGSGEEQK